MAVRAPKVEVRILKHLRESTCWHPCCNEFDECQQSNRVGKSKKRLLALLQTQKRITK